MTSIEERAKKYVHNLKHALKDLDIKESKFKEYVDKIIEYAKRYLSDAEYYLEKKDYITSIVCSSYAEGLLDSLKLLGLVDFKWPSSIVERKKVIVGGTFDIIHPGHIVFLREAAKLGDLVVIVARDNNVVKFKGKKPINDEEHRLFVISNIKGVYKARLGDLNDIIKPIIEEKPDIIFLGPDQKVDESWLKRELEKRGLRGVRIIRMKNRFKDVGIASTSAIVRRIIERYCHKG